MSSFVKSHTNFASLGSSLNFGQSSPMLLSMISLLSMYNGQYIYMMKRTGQKYTHLIMELA
jgi:hypothetical protein